MLNHDMQTKHAKSVGWKQSMFVLFTTLVAASIYAFIRYNIVRDVPYSNIPLFIGNKSIALTATILIGISFLLGPLARFFPNIVVPRLYLRKHLGIAGFALAALHALMSLILFSPAYYPKFFLTSGKMNLIGESSMLFGILAFLVFAAISITSLPPIEKHMHPLQWKFIQRLGYLAYVLVLFHVVIMGWAGWWNPESWKFGLASISIISALVIVFVLIMRVIVMVFPKKNGHVS